MKKIKITKNYCCESCGNLICSRTACYGKRNCTSCANKGKLNNAYIDGRRSKHYFCIDCNKEI